MRYLHVIGVLVVALVLGADLAHADLLSSAEKGDLEGVRKALDTGADPNALPDETWGALHIATLGGHEQVVSLLIKRGAKLELRQFGVTPLHLAIDKGHMKVVRVLLEAGANVASLDNAYAQPLHKATKAGNRSLVELLLTHKAKLEAVDRYGSTPLAISVSEGHFELVQLFLARKANVNARLKDGRRPLHIALREGNDKIMGVLLEAGATQDLLTAAALGNIDLIKKFIADGASIELLMGWSRTTPIMWAARAGQAAAVKYLVLNGAQVGALDQWKSTVLHYAAAGGSVDAVRVVLDHGGRINAKNQIGTTPLLGAAKAGHGPVIALLAKRGADANASHMSEGRSALYEAAYGGHAGAVRALLLAGADVTRTTGTGRSPMHTGVARADVLELLLDAGAKVDVQSRRKRTALHEAAQGAHQESALLLLKRGANVAARDDRRLTPLHCVASKSFAESLFDEWDESEKVQPKKDAAEEKARGTIAAALLKAGADPLAKDARGKTALDLARANAFESVVALIEKALELR